jgi:hypothetical protein
MLGCGLKTAWHLGHRIRHAMAPTPDAGPLGGPDKTVEATKRNWRSHARPNARLDISDATTSWS